MKKLIVLVFVIVLGFNQSFASNDKNSISTEQQIRDEVAVLLKDPEIKIEKADLTATIQFTINTNGEVVVLNVDSHEDSVVTYIKSRLNYKKVTTEKSVTTNRIFRLPLKIKKPNTI
ncbi:hypothetical protein D1816_19805 [Aquimarina sp. AD10]|uniref:TonB C-terminal domain-containing protein n=1 Tax=Aquimarina aggregata TaxID=1642818 RepID=A0A162CRC6_9FLAO|nr:MULTISPECIES: hypothetical protein [Aquimarina]AXT62511.1 hypothetical protein D1816_19805 [Aquimarina sp. AD10]KZS41014.1 hypothetical protein AWE51_23975 [Aquimarina aggregata]RKM90297.1 hypothetical protein D7033_22605 [Aquimarina sp. AD10]